jgi:Flp pilus assembly protein TadG
MRRQTMKRRGTTTVEFAIVAPTLFLLLLSIVELWNINFYRNTACEAAYAASRRGIVPGIDADDLRNVAQMTMQKVGARGVTVDVEPETILEDTELVEVSVSFPISANSWIVSKFFPGDGVITRTSSLNRELTTN